MENFKSTLNNVLVTKILERSVRRCFGCISGSTDRSDHSCTDSNVNNIELFFNSTFDVYVRRNSVQLIRKLKQALLEDLLVENEMDREAAKTIVNKVCFDAVTEQESHQEVSSSTL